MSPLASCASHATSPPAPSAPAVSDPAVGSDFLTLSLALDTPLCVVVACGRELHANPCCARAVKVQADALAGLSWLSCCLLADTQSQVIAAWIAGVGRQEAFTPEAPLLQRGGGPGACLWQVMPVAEGGAVARWIIMATAARAPQADRDRAGAGPGWYRDSFEQAAAGIAHVALDGSFIEVNDRLCAIVGHAREQLLHGGIRRITHPDDLWCDGPNVAVLLEGGVANYTLEKRYLRADGTTVWAQLTVGLVRRRDGTPDHFVAVLDDISKRRAVKAALAAQQRLMQFQLRLSECVHSLTDPLEMMQAATLLVAVLGALAAWRRRRRASRCAPAAADSWPRQHSGRAGASLSLDAEEHWQ